MIAPPPFVTRAPSKLEPGAVKSAEVVEAWKLTGSGCAACAGAAARSRSATAAASVLRITAPMVEPRMES